MNNKIVQQKLIRQAGKIKFIFTMIVVLTAFAIIGCIVFPSITNKPDVDSLANDIENSRNALADIFTVSRRKARELKQKDVLIASELVVSSFADIQKLDLPTLPSQEHPYLFNFQIMLYPGMKILADKRLGNLYMSPIIAWHKLSAEYPNEKFPVLLGHPSDDYRLGAKPLRIRWLTYAQLQKVLKTPSVSLTTEKWPWFKQAEVIYQLNSLQG